jgi:hypothetical protein
MRQRRHVNKKSQKNQVIGASPKRREPADLNPLEESAGGDFCHSGGKHWSSQTDRIADAENVFSKKPEMRPGFSAIPGVGVLQVRR